ncbi:virulence-associated E family protein [Altererythrobacter sp. BO-6]|uniref:VapE domain-containing protein n=1 Tax=Altererythrobacter sp. BO-6 TaxID=2604537 RepID=UPI0013E1BCA0|nr:VapE domain-containing protein [Altererythrobacter sp. BO-6]QIG53757.1 virulence-associated E family protein [Altererythrobacter sp. BO-6]
MSAGADGAGGSQDPSAHDPLSTSKSTTQEGKLERASFPDQPRSPGKALPATYENFRHLLDGFGIKVRFNLVKKRVDVTIPGLKTGRQNRDEVVLASLESLLHRHEMSTGSIRSYLLLLADQHPYDPFAEWVDSKPWDGTSRLPEFYETLVPVEDYSLELRDVLMRKWLLSIVAATFKKRGFRCRGVLTLQGAQGLGKTTWIARLVTPLKLREQVVKLGHSWDRGQKDAKLSAIRHRIVELGELEGSFKSQMPALKAFITETEDKIRPPYGRVEAEYPRTTIFAASVNDAQFLQDTTGNSRFWTIALKQIDYQHSIDMQQLFAEAKVLFEDGEEWWLNREEDAQLEQVNQTHRVKGTIETLIIDAIDPSREASWEGDRLTANEVLAQLGYDKPTNAQSKEANVALRALLGEPKRVRGQNRWFVLWKDRKQHRPAHQQVDVEDDDDEDDDLY